jgi:tetratricopeptide (TPR) repeat protein
MKALLVLVGLVLFAAVGVQTAAVGGAWWLHRQGRYDEEIRWLESLKPVARWDAAYDQQVSRRYRERVRRQLDAGRVDLAVDALRRARARDRATGAVTHRELMALGIEAYTRAADRMEGHGRLSAAADWDDSLFVLAVRAAEPHHRYAAIAAFMEGLDLRIRDGQACAALARVEWAKRGLGGTIPDLQPSVEEDLRIQCDRARGRRR